MAQYLYRYRTLDWYEIDESPHLLIQWLFFRNWPKSKIFEVNFLMHLICFSGELCFGLNFSASKSWFLNLEPVHFNHVMAYRVFLKHTFLKSPKSFSTRKESNWEFGIGIYYLKWTIWKTNPTFGLNQLLDRWSFATCSQNQERVWKFTAWRNVRFIIRYD